MTRHGRLLAVLTCSRLCVDLLGYEFFIEKKPGDCVCAEHVDSFSVIPDFNLRFKPTPKEPEDQTDDRAKRVYEVEE